MMLWATLALVTAAQDISSDVAYLHAVASVHEFCAEDFAVVCQGSKRRRLSEMISVTVFTMDDEEDHVDHSKSRIPLGLGRRGDWCLRRSLKDVSPACSSSVALVDATTPPDEHGCGFFIAGLLIMATFLVVFSTKLAKLRKLRFVLRAIKQNPTLKAQVLAAGIDLPAPKKGCCQTFVTALAALTAGYALTLVLGPALALFVVWVVLVPAALLNHCCLRRPSVSSTDEVPSLYVPPNLDEKERGDDDVKLLV